MTTRYTEKQIEDVARILLEHVLLSRVSPMTHDLVNTFADLFAADNPPELGWGCGPGCLAHRGFDRAAFLIACGLEGS
jgi:hypothetical protein